MKECNIAGCKKEGKHRYGDWYYCDIHIKKIE